jgi:predicted phosphoribosyltransferase
LAAAGAALADRIAQLPSDRHPTLVLTPARRGVPVAVAVAGRCGVAWDLVPGVSEPALWALRGTRGVSEAVGQQLLLVDDGIGTGQTMRAAAQWALGQDAARVDIAVPIAPREPAYELSAMLGSRGSLLALQQPLLPRSVAWAYLDFTAPSDAEVAAALTQPGHAGEIPDAH